MHFQLLKTYHHSIILNFDIQSRVMAFVRSKLLSNSNVTCWMDALKGESLHFVILNTSNDIIFSKPLATHIPFYSLK
jgi:hypothetical protein